MVSTIHMTVKTVRGSVLGNVCDIIWDADSFVMLQLKVRKNIFDRNPVLVHVSRVIRVEKDAIIIDNAEVTDAQQERSAQIQPKRATAPLQRGAKM